MPHLTAEAHGVPRLTGSLPPDCHNDLRGLRTFIHSAIGLQPPAKAVTADRFREVLLTGVTGFVGRILLIELLRSNPSLTVHCLVRADKEDEGFTRVRHALEVAELWDESLAQRVRIIPGDLGFDRFGLSEEKFSDLCAQIDAVYHMGANTSLAQSYQQMRRTNVLGMRPVLALCLRKRYKHLFLASTLAIFPEYLHCFAGEYAGRRIDHHAQPDLALMKQSLPLGSFGYPWSKLICEQAVQAAKDAGVPVAIFRFPFMAQSSTGYSQWDNPEARMFAAMAMTGKATRGLGWQSDHATADTASSLCAAISMNPERLYTVYHCVDSESPSAGLGMEDFGIYFERVPYASFKRACVQLGKDSPVYGLWPLLDRIISYWLMGNRKDTKLPVSVRSVVEDCPFPIRWPPKLVTYGRAHIWKLNNSDDWPYPIPTGCLDADQLLKRAEHFAQASHVRYSDVYPANVVVGLQHLVAALNLPEARLRDDRKAILAFGVNRMLKNRALLARERQTHSAIRTRKITHPVFIVGINRTGTTFLHRLLYQDPQFWAPKRYEMNEPLMPDHGSLSEALTKSDPRRDEHAEVLKALGLAKRFSGIHPFVPDGPEEDYTLLQMSFCSWTNAIANHIPSYTAWLKEADFNSAYAYHRQVLQYFSWQRLHSTPQRTWLLKMPFHLKELGALLKAYPDAIFIQTHRQPGQFMGSWSSLAHRLRGITTEPFPQDFMGREQLPVMSRMLNEAIDFRSANMSRIHRWIDVRFVDLVSTPLKTVKSIYDQLGWSLSEQAESAMIEWLRQKAIQRKQVPRHKYRLEDYGLSIADVHDAFAPYLEFTHERRLL